MIEGSLLSEALKQLSRKNKSCVTLSVDAHRQAAIALYRKMGFVVDADGGDEFRMILEMDV